MIRQRPLQPGGGMCNCFHDSDDHVHNRGRCRARDSYDQPCQCPSFERYVYGDEHPDDDWDEFQPDGKGG